MFGFTGIVFGEEGCVYDPNCILEEFTIEEINEMRNKAVIFEMHDGTLTIELFPEDAPNTVNQFLKLAEAGYYNGMVFHRIIPGFVIQAGDPNTKDQESDQSLWGTGGPGYTIGAEFNTIKHDRGIVSMARSSDINSAGSQFFIVHKDSNFLDGEYTAFGRLVPLGYSFKQLDFLAGLHVNPNNVPTNLLSATILNTSILNNFTPPPLDVDRTRELITTTKQTGGVITTYFNQEHNVKFTLPYRWDVNEPLPEREDLYLVIEPGNLEHNIQTQIEKSGFTPQIIIFSEEYR